MQSISQTFRKSIPLWLLMLSGLLFSLPAQVVMPPGNPPEKEKNEQPPQSYMPMPPGLAPGPSMNPPTGHQMALSEMLGEASLAPAHGIRRLPPLWPYYLSAGLFFLLLLLLLTLLLLRRKKKQRPEPFIPADVLALNALENLKPLIKAARAREFSYEASEIIRTYIEARFNIRARNQTTREFLEMAMSPDSTLPSKYERALDRFLHFCDLAKFAREKLDPEQLGEMHQSARQFVMDTRPSIMASPAESGPSPERKEARA